jgi:hypothetical protein
MSLIFIETRVSYADNSVIFIYVITSSHAILIQLINMIIDVFNPARSENVTAKPSLQAVFPCVGMIL